MSAVGQSAVGGGHSSLANGVSMSMSMRDTGTVLQRHNAKVGTTSTVDNSQPVIIAPSLESSSDCRRCSVVRTARNAGKREGKPRVKSKIKVGGYRSKSKTGGGE